MPPDKPGTCAAMMQPFKHMQMPIIILIESTGGLRDMLITAEDIIRAYTYFLASCMTQGHGALQAE